MIVGKILGGLGNQMFQYAFYKYLSNVKDIELKLDLEGFETYELHNGFELSNVFNLNDKDSSNLDIHSYKSNFPLLFKIENKLINKNMIFGKKHFKENNYNINPKIFDYKINDFYVEGYFQTFKYIEYLNTKGVSLFEFNTSLDEKEKLIFQDNCVSIHIRGGDYINNPKDKEMFGNICTTSYYKKAIEYIKKNIKNPKFIVFTNDIHYAETILNENKYTIINWNENKNSFRDMFLMTQCKHNIIANSSFSWWGAYLNSNKNKSVLAPLRWFNSKSINQENILPLNWIKLSNNGDINE